MTKLFLIAVALSASAFVQAAQREGAAGDDYPNKPVRLVVPSAPGSGTDLVGRMVGQALSESWGRPVVVDNRGGAGGIPAVTLVAKETARDGYTMLLGSSGHFSFAPVLYSKLPYDPQKELTPISLVATQPFVVAVHPSVPAASIKDLIAYVKGKPGGVHYGSGGSGTATHLGTELLQLTAGMSMLHVPYRGSGPGMTALIGGEIQLLMPGLAQAMPLMNSGKIKVLALTGAKRSRVAPELPTVAESGLPGFEFDVWYGMVFPGGIPRPILVKANADIAKALKAPAVNQRFTALGLDPVTTSPEEFAALIKRDAPKWERVVKAANIRIE